MKRLARDESVPQKVKIGAVQREGEVDVWTGELKVILEFFVRSNLLLIDKLAGSRCYG